MSTRGAPKQSPKLDGMIISDVSIKQPVFITMLMLLIVVIGLLAYSTLPVNLFPEISIPTVAVSLQYPGAGPESVADQVTRPVEDALSTLSGVRHITSTSSEGNAQIVIEFASNVNVDEAEVDVREKVNGVVPRLPRDVLDPSFFKFDPDALPILTVAIATEGGQSPLQLRQLVDDEIVPQLQRVSGVGSVTANGGQQRQINVLMDLNKLKAYSVLPAQISRALQTANTTLGLGSINAGERDVSLRAPSMIQQPADILNIQITGSNYRIGDVATVQDGVADSVTYARLDGRDAITVDIQKQSGTNTVAVADDARAEIERIFAARPDLKYVISSDQSESIKESTQSAIDELIIASVAAMLIVLLFFRDLRNTIITVIGLPVIMIGTFAALSLFGLTINLITLLALSLSVGLVIDDAIVVRENIFRHMERGETPIVAASRGTAEVSLSVLAMTLTIISVFLPVAFTSGITGIIFQSFGITVASAMAISLFEAFTLAPMLSAYFFKQKVGKHGHKQHAAANPDLPDEANEELGATARFYEGVLRWSLRRRWVVVLATVLILAFSGWVATGLKFSFFPAQDTHQFVMSFELDPGSPLASTDALARQAEAVLLKDPAVETVQTTVGGAGSPETASLNVKLHEEEPTTPAQDRLRPQLNFLPKLAFGQSSFQGSSSAITARPIQVRLQTNKSVDTLVPVLQQLAAGATQIQGLTDIDTTYKPGKPELQFHVNPAKIGSLGVTNDDLATTVRALINGDRATTLRQNGDDTDIVVRLRPDDRSGVPDLRAIAVPTAGGSIPLSSIATVELSAGPTAVRRYDRQNQVLVGANLIGRNAIEVQQEVQAAIATLEVPPDVTVSYGGTSQQTTEGFETLFIAMGLSVLFVYMVLASQFSSFLQPFVIMMAMPFSFLGAFLALRITGIDLDITGMIGLIMLLGLVTKNSILLVDFTNRLRAAGMEKHAALERAGAVRLRPILMTTLAIVVGSIPVAIGIGEGSEFRRALSIVVIGGLITSMLLTLLVVPTVYSLVDSLTSGFGRLVRRRQKPAVEPAPAEEPALVPTIGAPANAAATPPASEGAGTD